MKIALIGFDTDCPNKGCEALTYSFLGILRKFHINKLEIFIFGDGKLGVVPKEFPEFIFHSFCIKLKSIFQILKIKRLFSNMDYIFDVTYGDGFSDIYGKKWNFRTDFVKNLAIHSHSKLVLMPQTYGPFSSKFLKAKALKIIKKSYLAFARDDDSAEEYNSALNAAKIISVTDMAFSLPFISCRHGVSSKVKIGINISSLLWYREHSDQIILKLNYHKLMIDLIQQFNSSKYEVHLIPHVIDLQNFSSLENDSRVCKEIHKEFPNSILAPDFHTPIEAKNYISQMDLFFGSRMHSTIASLSSGVVTIPIAYSKKFKGLFGSLGYPYFIDCTIESNESALLKINGFLSSLNELKKAQNYTLENVKKKTEKFENDLISLFH